MPYAERQRIATIIQATLSWDRRLRVTSIKTGSSNATARNGEEVYRYRGPGNNPYQTEQDELIKAVKSGTPVNCGDFMCNSTMVGILGQIAAYQGNAVKYEDAYKADFHFGGIEPDNVNMTMEPPTLPDETGNYPIPVVGQTRFVG